MTTLVTPGNPESISPDGVGIHPFDVLHQSLLNYTTTLMESANLSDRAVVRIPFTNPGQAPAWVGEGEVIEETRTSIDELTIPTRKIATIKTISNEALNVTNSGAESVSAMVISQAKEDVLTQADQALLMPTVSPGGLKGVLGHINPNPEPEDPDNPEPPTPEELRGYLTDGGTLGDNLDPFVDAIANIIDQGGREEDITILASPAAWSALAKLKDTSNGNRPLIDAMAPTFEFAIPNSQHIIAGGGFQEQEASMKIRSLMGIPLLVTPIISDPSQNGRGNIIISDRRNIVSAASMVTMTTSGDAAFQRDSTSYRMTYRLGWKIFNPSRITYLGTVA